MLKFKYHINTFTYLRFSLNLTVAAQWNIMLIESMMISLSSSLRASLGWVSSLLIAITFSLKSGFSSRNLSKSYPGGNIFQGSIFQLSETHQHPTKDYYSQNFNYVHPKIAILNCHCSADGTSCEAHIIIPVLRMRNLRSREVK